MEVCSSRFVSAVISLGSLFQAGSLEKIRWEE